MSEDSRKTILVKIRNRQRSVFQGEVNAVTSENESGVFDVLPQHANFISIIKNKIIIRGLGNKKQEIQIESAILKVWSNQVSIYLDILSPISS